MHVSVICVSIKRGDKTLKKRGRDDCDLKSRSRRSVNAAFHPYRGESVWFGRLPGSSYHHITLIPLYLGSITPGWLHYQHHVLGTLDVLLQDNLSSVCQTEVYNVLWIIFSSLQSNIGIDRSITYTRDVNMISINYRNFSYGLSIFTCVLKCSMENKLSADGLSTSAVAFGVVVVSSSWFL